MVHTLHVVERGHERDASVSSEEERETNSFTHLISSSVGFLVKLDHQRTSQGGGEFRQEQREIVTKIVELGERGVGTKPWLRSLLLRSSQFFISKKWSRDP